MADGKLYEQAQIQPIYMEHGHFNSPEFKKRYLKAPFDRVMMQVADDGVYDTFLQPRNFGADATGQYANLDVFGWVGIGFETLDIIVISGHDMGNWDRADEGNWKTCFELHFV
jgi:hypothetical protein